MTVKLRAIILGSGSSGGVPRFGGPDGTGDWGACDPSEPKNRRTRCSILVQREHPEFGFRHDKVTSVLVDTSPDMRSQLLAAKCSRLDAVLFTHDHADQCHGIDDLRVFALQMRKQMPVYIDTATSGFLLERFDYCFVQKPGSLYPPILEKRDMPGCGDPFVIDGPSGPIPVTAFLQHHGGVDSLGFRFGDIAYSSDVVALPEASFQTLAGVNTWIVDALQYKPHKTHAHLDLTLKWLTRMKPKRGILTNLHVSMDYQTLKKALPAGVEPAFDGLTVDGIAE
ncbi:MBL fold metallo-hydrolase [Hyphococcus sp.]|uniref:MBL fold metallo-hydrolase n=1 Tax=Hyphococcus sp. TaxID=2038636 RepID=UPI002082CA31|nr:MAG: phosphoribosyl 1,2-cyclic phosphodiesterase [Marinicaulis sp.]